MDFACEAIDHGRLCIGRQRVHCSRIVNRNRTPKGHVSVSDSEMAIEIESGVLTESAMWI